MQPITLIAQPQQATAPAQAYTSTTTTSSLLKLMHRCHCAGHTIFSLSLAQGIMTAYGSYSPDTTDVHTDNLWICFANTLVELVAGFAVFSTLGNMAARQTALAAVNPELRMNICRQAFADGAEPDCGPQFDSCEVCGTGDWQLGGACCGAFETSNVADIGRKLGFTVRS